MKNSFHFALRTGHHEVLLLAPLLGCLLLAASLFVPRLGSGPSPEDPDRFRRVTQMGAIDRTMTAIRAGLAAESPLVVKERGLPAAEAPAETEKTPPAGEDAAPMATDPSATLDGDELADPDDPVSPAPLVLAGIAERSGRRYAIINRQVMGIGGEIAGFKLVEVNSSSVTLRDTTGTPLTLILGQEIKP